MQGKRSIITLIFAYIAIFKCFSQFYFGPALGPGVNFQRWEDFNNDPLFSLNADFFVESVAEETKSAFFAMVGYRTRGSSNIYNSGTGGLNISSYKYSFSNAVLELGAKRYITEASSRPYYMVGVRGEYNIRTNLKQYERFQTPFFPGNDFVKKFTYGFTFGGGYDFKISEMLNGFVQITMCPDINEQYYQPPLFNVPAPGGFGTISLQERRVKNTSIEIKFGLKILRKVIYE